KQIRSLHSQRSVKRPVEGNISQKKTFVKRRGSALPASPIPVIPSSVFPYAMQQGISFGFRGRQRRLKPALERNERSEFNFLFRDTAGFQTDLPGSGTQN
ncbi:MAG: hypothetical protein II077_18380, partial [Treponema sp.]|nr:hypothetical protein [Treponema sp.]